MARLEEAGWVASEPVPSGRGRKRLYAICDLGRAELRRWLAEPTQPAPLRDELMVRLRAEAAVGPSDLAAAIAQRVATHQAKLALYQSFEHKDFATCTNASREHRLKHLVLKAGIRQEQLWIELANEALGILEAPPPIAIGN